jgi:class 3 adenylate cyclase
MGWTRTYSIGRAPDSDVLIPDDPLVSRQHASLMLDHKGGLYLADLKSRHGSFVFREDVWQRLQGEFVRPEEPVRFGRFQTTAQRLVALAEARKGAQTGGGTASDDEATRRNVTVMLADIVGYSRMMSREPGGTLGALQEARRDAIDPVILRHGGRVFGEAGDSVCAEFGRSAEAVRCAVELQQALGDRRFGPGGKRLQLRIGIHAGTVMAQGKNLYGSAVNIAARLQSLSAPGRICVSALVKRLAGRRIGLGFNDLGERALKNIPYPVRVFEVADTPKNANPA